MVSDAEPVSLNATDDLWIIGYGDGSEDRIPKSATTLELLSSQREEQGDTLTARKYREWAANIRKYGAPIDASATNWTRTGLIAGGILAASAILAWVLRR